MHWELVQNLIQRLWLFKSDHQTNQQRRREKEQYIPSNCTFSSAFAFLAIAQVNRYSVLHLVVPKQKDTKSLRLC